ncbi:hypothetical protein NL676_024153 [Syzygium grande]|nr:hypothetical protein NL676_024153 [Syzygium grande]
MVGQSVKGTCTCRCGPSSIPSPCGCPCHLKRRIFYWDFWKLDNSHHVLLFGRRRLAGSFSAPGFLVQPCFDFDQWVCIVLPKKAV